MNELDESQLKEIIAAVMKVDVGEISEATSMDTLEKWDSLAHMNLVLTLESEYGISLPDDDAVNMTSYKLIKMVLGELLGGLK